MIGNAFPKPADAANPMTAITITHRGVKIVFGIDNFKTDDPSVKYFHCRSEKELLEKFLTTWIRLDLDIITGWNINGFDIPYLVNRITKVLGADEAKKLSPWGVLEWRTIKVMGREQSFVRFVGMEILDYIELYKKFNPGGRESFKLEYIANYELGEGKLDYSEYGSLYELQTQNYQKYIEYNIHDAVLIDKLNQKQRLIELAVSIAYSSGVNYSDALGTVKLWDIIIHGYLRNQGKVIPHVEMTIGHTGIEGAYVKDPKPAGHDWVMSFDVTSLYPSIFMQANISPETYLRTVDGINVGMMLDGSFEGTELQQKLRDNNAGICASGAIFDNAIEGFLPTLIEERFNLRQSYQRKMKAAEKQLEALEEQGLKDTPEYHELYNKYSEYNTAQAAIKILINSLYGAAGNAAFRWFAVYIAESITLTGQLIVQWAERTLNRYLNKRLKTKDVEYVCYCDTDSAYVVLADLVKAECQGMSKEEIVDYLDDLAKSDLQPALDKGFKALQKYLNHCKAKINMKREVIAERAIWTGKKHYIMSVWDKEGLRYKEPKVKMQGIEAVKSSTPAAAREMMKKGLTILLGGNETQFQEFVRDCRTTFNSLPFDQVAFPKTCNNIDKYSNNLSVFEKGCPIHVRGSLMFNYMIEQKGLQKVLQPIEEGEKIKFTYLKTPNPAGTNVISTTGELPKQLGLDEYIDYNTQFEKSLLNPLGSLARAIQWSPEYVPTLKGLFYDD